MALHLEDSLRFQRSASYHLSSFKMCAFCILLYPLWSLRGPDFFLMNLVVHEAEHRFEFHSAQGQASTSCHERYFAVNSILDCLRMSKAAESI